MSLQKELNRLAGTTALDAQGAANVWAGTTGLDLVGALNHKAGTVGLGLLAVLNRLASPVVATNLSTNPRSITAWGNNNGNIWLTSQATVTGHPLGITTATSSHRIASDTTSDPNALSLFNIDGLSNDGRSRGIGVWLMSPYPGYAGRCGTAGQGTQVDLAPGVWTFVSTSAPVTGYSSAYIFKKDGSAADLSHTVYATGSIALLGSVPAAYFDGDTPDTPDLEYAWTGAPNASTSTKRSLLHLGMDAAAARIV